jgi:transcriptional regulator with XRE-family HTH domain
MNDQLHPLLPEHNATIGTQIRFWRERRGWFQKDLAQKLGLGPGSESQISRYETGEETPHAGTLYNIARVLGVPLVVWPEGPEVVAEVATKRRPASGGTKSSSG